MKKIITKKQYLKLNIDEANKMDKDIKLKKISKDLFVKADKYRWLYQFSWLGEPIINLTTDMFAIQEIIFRTKPKNIIEIGVAWGGSLLFYASLLKYINNGKVIGVDIFMPKNLKKRINFHNKKLKNINLINGDSLNINTYKKIKKLINNSKNNLIVLDSYHTHEHVLKELNLYSSLVSKGNYIICCDTIVNRIPNQSHRKREWGPKNNPETALIEFLKNNKRFKIDKSINKKILLTNHPNGYIFAIN